MILDRFERKFRLCVCETRRSFENVKSSCCCCNLRERRSNDVEDDDEVDSLQLQQTVGRDCFGISCGDAPRPIAFLISCLYVYIFFVGPRSTKYPAYERVVLRDSKYDLFYFRARIH